MDKTVIEYISDKRGEKLLLKDLYLLNLNETKYNSHYLRIVLSFFICPFMNSFLFICSLFGFVYP